LAQPAASVQHLAQVALSLQQLPSQAVDALELEALLLVEQPVVINIPAAKTAAKIITVFILFYLWLFLDVLPSITLASGPGKSLSQNYLASAARIFFRYFAGSLSKSAWHIGQQNLTSWP
jgi:hypothetical protein